MQYSFINVPYFFNYFNMEWPLHASQTLYFVCLSPRRQGLFQPAGKRRSQPPLSFFARYDMENRTFLIANPPIVLVYKGIALLRDIEFAIQ